MHVSLPCSSEQFLVLQAAQRAGAACGFGQESVAAGSARAQHSTRDAGEPAGIQDAAPEMR